jgi:hypothetical protein
MKSVDDIVNTLKTADNEGTESPYWMVIDPGPLRNCLEPYTNEEGKTTEFDYQDNLKSALRALESSQIGPFFCREDAENYLKSRHYEYSEDAYVYCYSGYWSQKYKAMCREIGVGKNEQKIL